MVVKTKTCSKCHKTKPLDEFYNDKDCKNGKRPDCKECVSKQKKRHRQEHKEEINEQRKEHYKKHHEEINKQRREHYQEHSKEILECRKKYRQEHKDEMIQKRGQKSMYKNKLCASYLGIVIAERLVRHLFNDVEVMPNNHSGFDFICNKGMKIDVKSACVTFTDKNPRWIFNIDYNKKCDFFIFVAFDNRTDLNPLHLWMIPGHTINKNSSKSISPSRIHKWDKWKMNIKDARICCNEIKKKNK